MKIIDAHVHLYPEPILERECNISQEPVNEHLLTLSKKLIEKNITQAVVYILDEKVLLNTVQIPKNLIPAITVGIHSTYQNDIEKALSQGYKIIKILPYDQHITRDIYFKVLTLAEFAEENKMVLTICSTYGSKLIYDTNGIELAALIKKKYDVPIILAHGGGPKIFDAMSLALEYENVFLDVSFSLKYWWSSSVIQDYAFALHKLESKRCFYGSDYPYVDFDESLKYFLEFVKKYDFSEEEKKQLLFLNFNSFKKRYV
jgi:predicted TIM-barrel fold metal-dependent hydrolase